MMAPATLSSSQWNHPRRASTAISGFVLGVLSAHPNIASELIRTVVRLNISLDESRSESRSCPSAAATKVSATEPMKMNVNSMSTSSRSSRGRLMSTVRMCQISSPRLSESKASLRPSGIENLIWKFFLKKLWSPRS